MGRTKRFIQNPGSNAICYYRYSSEAQRDVSIVQQQEAAKEYAAHHGYHIIKEYSDSAMSGTRFDRPGLQLMLHEAEKLKPAYLILWKTDRLSRNREDTVIAKARLKGCGVKIVYVAEAIPEGDEATEILLESIHEAVAASFIVAHRQNVMRGLTYNAENALYNGVKILGYSGKPNCKYEIDDSTAPIVRRIFSEYTQGVPMQKICNGLNEAGLKTNKGNKFSVNSMRGILANRAYIGEYKFGDIVIPDGIPPIIDDLTFQAAQAKLEANKRGGKGAVKKIHPEVPIENYWLSGKLYCGLGGETVQGMSGTSRGGRLYYYYSCKNHRKHKCALKSQRKGLLEKIVLYTLDDLSRDTALRLMIAEICYAYHQQQNDDSGAYEASIKTRLKEVEDKLKNIMKAVEAGIFNDTTAERMKELESQKSMLRDELLAEQNRKRCCIKLSDIVKYMDGLVGNINDPDTRVKLLDIYVDRIYVYPDKLAMTFNYTDDKRELPFEEMEAFIDNRQKIMSMLDDYHGNAVDVSPEVIASLIGNGEDDTDFFP